LVSRNRLDEARQELEKIATIYPDFYVEWKADLAGLGGKWADLILGNLDSLRIDPQSVQARIYLSLQFASIGLEKESLAIFKTLCTVLSILGQPEAALFIAEERLAEYPNINYFQHRLGKQLASTGDYARARPILEEIWQRSGGRVTPSDGLFFHDNAEALITIRRDAGEEARVGELVAAIRDDVRRKREAGMIRAGLYNSVDYEEGIADFMAGEREKGLALIAKGANDGYFIPPRETHLQMLYDDPGFAPILAGQEARQARERNRFLAIVCTDNPYAAVWQPAEGTCERFATEGGN